MNPPKVIFNHTNTYPQKFLELLSDTDGYVLDCGSGDRRLDRDNVINLDIMRSMGVDVIGDGHRLPFKDNSFELILSQATLEHYEQPWIAAEELYRVCKNGGIIYAEAAFMQPFHAAPYHFFNMTVLGIEELFYRFTKIESGAFGGLSDTIPWIIGCTSAKNEKMTLEKVKLICRKLDDRIEPDELKNIASGVFFCGIKADRGCYIGSKNQQLMEGQILDTFEIRDEEIDVEEIMRKIRENIRRRKEAGIYPEGEIEETDPAQSSSDPPHEDRDGKPEPISLSPEARRDLDYINSNWDVENKGYFISSHRPVSGKFLIRGRELVHGEVRRYVDPAIWKQKEFNASAVRLLNEVARSVEQVSAKLTDLEGAIQGMRSDIEVETDDRFNRVVSELESQIEGIRSDIEVKTDDRFNRVVSELESQIEGMRSDIEVKTDDRFNRVVSELESQIEGMRSDIEVKTDDRFNRVVSELESKIEGMRSDLGRTITNNINSTLSIMNEDIKNKSWLAELLEVKLKQFDVDASGKINNIDMNYFVFNTIYGGSDEEIRKNILQFVEYFQGCKNVLDIGSGRGIFLDLLRENDIDGYGVDVNEDLVLYCARKGLKVEKDDVISHLERLSDKSLDGIFASHVIEHLLIEDIVYLTDLCYRKLEYGSYVIFVMPNILNITVSSNTFYVDPTHVTHIHPNVIKFVMKSSGFRDLEERYYYPIPDECKMKRIVLNETNDPKDSSGLQHEQIDIINRNIDLLNNILFGCRDYAIIGKK